MWPPAPGPGPQPTLAGFQSWIYTFMGIPQAACPPGTVWIDYAYYTAIATVNLYLQALPGPIYLQAVYNLAGDLLVNWCPDQPDPSAPNGLFPYPGPSNSEGLGYFQFLRTTWNLNGFVPGVINASADESTSQSLTVPSQFDALTIGDLQNLKTPWGRAYLGIAQNVGTPWGFTP